MALSQFDKILKEYRDSDNDYGFSAVSEEEYIYWPNRVPALEEQIQRILELTRG